LIKIAKQDNIKSQLKHLVFIVISTFKQNTSLDNEKKNVP